MTTRKDKQGGSSKRGPEREDRDEQKRAKDLPPDKRKGREVKGGAARYKF